MGRGLGLRQARKRHSSCTALTLPGPKALPSHTAGPGSPPAVSQQLLPKHLSATPRPPFALPLSPLCLPPAFLHWAPPLLAVKGHPSSALVLTGSSTELTSPLREEPHRLNSQGLGGVGRPSQGCRVISVSPVPSTCARPSYLQN